MNKDLFNRKSVDLSKYVNTETGESLMSEMEENSTITVETKSDMYTIESEEYVVVDSVGIKNLQKLVGLSDQARFMQMANWLKTNLNIVFNNTKPHSLESLSELLGLSKDNTTRLAQRLVKAGLLFHGTCAPSGYVQKVYMLNPTVVRKRKTFNRALLNIFPDLSKP